MKRLGRILMVAMVASFLMVGSAMGYELGTNITIYDKMGVPTEKEDGTVEPGDQWGQEWDLEGFFRNGNILNMVGGYDFVNGGYGSGDIFIDINGDAKYGNPAAVTVKGDGYNSQINNTFGYDYVFDMDFAAKTFSLYQIGADALLLDVYYEKNSGSNPWRYLSGGTSKASGSFGYTTGLSDSAVGGLQGGKHNVVSLDITSLLQYVNPDLGFTAHFTMGCGNDNLMGGTPEPATMVLLGFGLIGMVALRKRFGK